MSRTKSKEKRRSKQKGERVAETSCIDALVEGSFPSGEEPFLFLFCRHGVETQASIYLYGGIEKREKEGVFVQMHLSSSVPLVWKDPFILKYPDTKKIWAKGRVLDPFSEKLDKKKKKKKLEYLKQLLGEEREMLYALIRSKGIHGLWQKEVMRFSSLPVKRLISLSQELEAEGLIRILSFSPLFLISQSSLLFLCQEIIHYLKRFHEKHPDLPGMRREKIRSRFGLHPRIFSLALKYLMQEKHAVEIGDQIALADFSMALLPEEEKILDRLEDMCLKGEFESVSLDVLQRSLKLSSKRLHKLLTLLMDRKKIVLSKDGFILHARWLDELVRTIRKSGKKELTVADFKKMSGLSRKYAIPLLELLDQLGVTQRIGSVRKIL